MNCAPEPELRNRVGVPGCRFFGPLVRQKTAKPIDMGYDMQAPSSVLAISDSIAEHWIRVCRAVGRRAFLDIRSRQRRFGYKTKLAAVLGFLENGLTRQEPMSKRSIARPTTYDRWVKACQECSSEALRPKPREGRHGRPFCDAQAGAGGGEPHAACRLPTMHIDKRRSAHKPR